MAGHADSLRITKQTCLEELNDKRLFDSKTDDVTLVMVVLLA